jgi:hypothetical protein
MSSSKTASLGSVTGRDEFIIGEALATALIALEQLPEERQPTRNMADMKMLLNSLYPPPDVSLHLTTVRWRFIPSSRPFGARGGERWALPQPKEMQSAERNADPTALTPDDVARIGFFRDDNQYELIRNTGLRPDIKWFLI